MHVQLIWHIQVDDNLKATSNYRWRRCVTSLCLSTITYPKCLIPTSKQEGKKYFSSSAPSLSPMRSNFNPDSSVETTHILLFCAQRGLCSLPDTTCSGTGQPMYNLVLGWGLITVPKSTESNEQFESSRQHLNTNRGSEWWIKHVLYQIYFFQTNRG